MTILIIDDDVEIRQLARAFLARGGATVIEADSGEAGVSTAERARPDVILLDAQLPGMDGAATLAHLRQAPLTASIPVIFLTATSRLDERQHLESLDALGIISKPFNPLTLSASVRDLLNR